MPNPTPPTQRNAMQNTAQQRPCKRRKKKCHIHSISSITLLLHTEKNWGTGKLGGALGKVGEKRGRGEINDPANTASLDQYSAAYAHTRPAPSAEEAVDPCPCRPYCRTPLLPSSISPDRSPSPRHKCLQRRRSSYSRCSLELPCSCCRALWRESAWRSWSRL